MKFSALIKLFVFWQLAVLIITAVSAFYFPLRRDYLFLKPADYLQNPFLYSRANFDGFYYLFISQNSYGYAQQAFFPFYPRLIGLFRNILAPPVLVGTLISLTAFFLGLSVFARLLRLDYDETTVRWIIVALLIFPTAWFFTAVYAEGLLFFLIVSSFWAARTRRWWLAGILGGLAAYTKFIGVFLFPALLFELWQQQSLPLRRRFVHILPLLLIPLGLLLYMVYLNKTVHDPLAFIHVQELFKQGRGDKIILLYQVFWRYLKMAFTVNRSDPLYFTILLEFSVGIVFFITSIYSLLRHRLSYSVFNLAVFIIPTLTGSLTSLPRYVLLAFPSFIIFGQWLAHTSPRKRYSALAACGLLFIICLSMFTRGYWVS